MNEMDGGREGRRNGDSPRAAQEEAKSSTGSHVGFSEGAFGAPLPHRHLRVTPTACGPEGSELSLSRTWESSLGARKQGRWVRSLSRF